ncbi:MAG: DUF3857 domain-containing transglutaminase family protein [Blastocatellia bacterium]
MFNHRHTITFLLSIFITLFLQTSAGAAGKEDVWKPIDPEHKALKAPTVEKDADAEVLFWEVQVEKGIEGAELKHYLRIKIFTQRGCETQNKVELPYFNGGKITDIAGRTIKPDGSIVELRPDAVFETMLAKFGKYKVRAKSFAMPAVEPGVIIEYRYREVRKDIFFLRLQFQRDIPIQQVKYSVKQTDTSWVSMRMKPFNMKTALFNDEAKNVRSVKMTGVPAFRAEPQMPPENEVRAWMLVYYVGVFSEWNFWNLFGKEVYDSSKSSLKANDEIRKAANEAMAGATTPEQKLERIYDYCRTRIKNLEKDPSITEDDLARMKANKNPSETLRRGAGTGDDINLLFGAMANAAGFEARLAHSADRSDVFFDRTFRSPYFLSTTHIAVNVNNEWRFFDPASTYLPAGMLRWQEEGIDSLISDPVNANFTRTPLSPPEKSKKIRTATLKLNEDGSLEGEVRVSFTGHAGKEQKEALADVSPEEREKQLRAAVKEWLGAAEILEVKFENVTDPIKPLVRSYRVRVASYAQRTGKRLFLQPAFFQHNAKPMFPNQERKYSVYFRYPWAEEDTVTIQLPAGFELDNAEMPSSIRAEGVSLYDVNIQYDAQSRTLIYKRNFFFGGGGALIFPGIGQENQLAEIYPRLKKLFDMIHERDVHTISLKQSAIAAK